MLQLSFCYHFNSIINERIVLKDAFNLFVQSYHLIRDKREELLTPRVGIYKRKQESKKRKENTLLIKKVTKKTIKKKMFKLKTINKFYFQLLKIVSVICRFNQIEYEKMRLKNVRFPFLPFFS